MQQLPSRIVAASYDDWAKSLRQEHIDWMLVIDRSYPGSMMVGLKKLQKHGYLDEEFNLRKKA